MHADKWLDEIKDKLKCEREQGPCDSLNMDLFIKTCCWWINQEVNRTNQAEHKYKYSHWANSRRLDQPSNYKTKLGNLEIHSKECQVFAAEESLATDCWDFLCFLWNL